MPHHKGLREVSRDGGGLENEDGCCLGAKRRALSPFCVRLRHERLCCITHNVASFLTHTVEYVLFKSCFMEKTVVVIARKVC